MFTLTVFEILLSKRRSVLWPEQPGTVSKSCKVSLKNQKNIVNLLELLEKWLTYKLMRFWIVFNFFFLILFSPFNTEKIEKIDLWDASNYKKNININDLRTTSTKTMILISLESLFNIRWKLLKQRQCLLLPFSRYCCGKLYQYCDRRSGAQGAKGSKFQ